MTNANLDPCLQIVAESDRRRILRVLRHEGDGETSIDDLVDRLYSAHSDGAADRRADRDRLHVRLVHTHLPMLADHGVVEYDPGRETVRYQSDERLETVLDSLPGHVTPARR